MQVSIVILILLLFWEQILGGGSLKGGGGQTASGDAPCGERPDLLGPYSLILADIGLFLCQSVWIYSIDELPDVLRMQKSKITYRHIFLLYNRYTRIVIICTERKMLDTN